MEKKGKALSTRALRRGMAWAYHEWACEPSSSLWRMRCCNQPAGLLLVCVGLACTHSCRLSMCPAIKGRAGERAAARAQVITGSSDGTVRVWDGKTADCITAFRPPQAAPPRALAQFMLACAGDDALQAWCCCRAGAAACKSCSDHAAWVSALCRLFWVGWVTLCLHRRRRTLLRLQHRRLVGTQAVGRA
jgi:hypothetical protein